MVTIKEKTKRREAIITVAGYIRCKLSRKGVWEVEVEKVMIAQVPRSAESCMLKVEVPTQASGVINTHLCLATSKYSEYK